MLKVERLFLEQYQDTIIKHFSAKRNRQNIFKSEIRPDFERSIEYTGLDGKSALEEVRRIYGVSPRIIHFEIPDFGLFKIYSSGQFCIEKGGVNAKRYLLKVTEFATEDAILTRKTIESSNFKKLSVETQRKVLLFPKLKPWQIKFSTPVDFEAGQGLVDTLRENNFEMFNHVLEKGSLTLTG